MIFLVNLPILILFSFSNWRFHFCMARAISTMAFSREGLLQGKANILVLCFVLSSCVSSHRHQQEGCVLPGGLSQWGLLHRQLLWRYHPGTASRPRTAVILQHQCPGHWPESWTVPLLARLGHHHCPGHQWQPPCVWEEGLPSNGAWGHFPWYPSSLCVCNQQRYWHERWDNVSHQVWEWTREV